MAKFDLTTKNCEFLDRHLTFPLLEFLLSKDVNIQISNVVAVFECYLPRNIDKPNTIIKVCIIPAKLCSDLQK